MDEHTECRKREHLSRSLDFVGLALLIAMLHVAGQVIDFGGDRFVIVILLLVIACFSSLWKSRKSWIEQDF